jgi:hypothetical protein
MIILDFKIMEQSLPEDLVIGLREGALLETYLVLPVKFSVDEVDMLETRLPHLNIFQTDPSGNVEIVAVNDEQQLYTSWMEVPLLSLAIECYEKVREACDGGKSRYDIPGGGYLYFEPRGSKVSIHSTINGKTVETDCSKLMDAFAAFSVRVRHLAEDLFPELKMDATWNDWFMEH